PRRGVAVLEDCGGPAGRVRRRAEEPPRAMARGGRGRAAAAGRRGSAADAGRRAHAAADLGAMAWAIRGRRRGCAAALPRRPRDSAAGAGAARRAAPGHRRRADGARVPDRGVAADSAAHQRHTPYDVELPLASRPHFTAVNPGVLPATYLNAIAAAT